MDVNYFDIIVGAIVLLLGLKGIMNGFFKEFFGLVGIIGGIFIASRVSSEVGQFVSDLIFKFENKSAIDFTGFLVALALFWLLMVLAGSAFKHLSNLSGLGPLDRLFGFLFGSGKFFLIASVIAYAVFNINAVKKQLEPMTENSYFLPIMIETGGFIMKLDPTESAKSVNESVKKASDAVVDGAKESISKAMKTDSAK